MAALKVTTTMASSTSTPSSILRTKHPPHKWVRTLSPLTTTSTTAYATTTSGSSSPTSARTLVMSKSSAFINRKNGERMSVWWRDGWRLISCADFGQKNRTFLPQKPSFPSSQSSSQSSNNMGGASENKEEDQHHQQQQQQQQPAPKLLTIPTILTLGRVAAIPLLIATFYSNSWWATTLTTSIFVAAAITDWLDGYLARKMRLGTPFGAFLDPVADKLMVAATLVLLCTRPLEFGAFGEISWLLPIPSIAIIGREITMSAVREWAASQNGKVLEAVAVNNLGKWKTASQMTALTILLATRDTSIVGSHILVPSGVALLYISAGLAVWSLAVYMKKIWRILLKL